MSSEQSYNMPIKLELWIYFHRILTNCFVRWYMPCLMTTRSPAIKTTVLTPCDSGRPKHRLGLISGFVSNYALSFSSMHGVPTFKHKTLISRFCKNHALVYAWCSNVQAQFSQPGYFSSTIGHLLSDGYYS